MHFAVQTIPTTAQPLGRFLGTSGRNLKSLPINLSHTHRKVSELYFQEMNSDYFIKIQKQFYVNLSVICL
uniref:Uncharacterized protein n=1 Tax=uncultured Desulfobacterium sp. TaxID=201089 RepID=E1Y8Y3_9BACT|nr:unknown protein [uncultured Desulfobacterium sp.]